MARGPRAEAVKEASEGPRIVDFLVPNFQFPRGSRLMLDTCVLWGALDQSDLWNPIANWLFQTAIYIPGAPRTYIIDRVQGELAHVGTRAKQRAGAALGRLADNEFTLECRASTIQQLEELLGPHPMTVCLHTSDAVMAEWRTLYRTLPLDETDALLIAGCVVYGLDLVTVDNNLVSALRTRREHLSEPGYDFSIYYTVNASAPMPSST